MKREKIIQIISALLILLFIYTATSKLMEYRAFRQVLHTAPLVGSFSNQLAIALPIVEIAIGLLLFFPSTRRSGLWLSLAAMITFTVYIGYMLYFAETRPCSCGGVLQQMTWTQHFIFNIFFTLLAAIALWLDRKRPAQINPRFTFSASA